MTKENKENNQHFPSGFRYHTAIQLRFKDVDSMGHVNNANHLTYFETARMHYFHDVVAPENDWKKTGFILAKISIDYVQPVLLTDKVVVFTRCSRIGNKSFDQEYLITRKKADSYEILSKGLCVLVCYNYEQGVSIPILNEWTEKIKSFEGI